MTSINWSFRTKPDPAREYVVAATTGLGVAWRELRKVWAFQVYTRRILDQLNRTPGCVGFALHATLTPLTGSTLSVWDTAAALRHFYLVGAHGEALALLRAPGPGKFQYVQWKSPGDALPRTWEDVLIRFKPA